MMLESLEASGRLRHSMLGNSRRSSEKSGADFQQTCFARLRRLRCNRQPSAGNTSTPDATS